MQRLADGAVADAFEETGNTKMSKQKTMTVSWPHLNCDPNADAEILRRDPQVYRVDRVTNSVEFLPGQQLTKAEVADLCENGGWDVTCVPNKDRR